MKTVKNLMLATTAAVLFASQGAMAAPSGKTEGFDAVRVSASVRKQLVTLPSYNVFDNLAYKIEGGTVTLYGDVTRPWTKKDAEARVKRIGGVDRVVNEIHVLPLSAFDDSIRYRAYRAVFGTGSLYRYAMGSNPSLHIVVDHGALKLEGVVANRLDAQLADVAARQVSGVFSVQNNLVIENAR